MRQVVQPLSGGAVQVLDVPRPGIDGTEVLVRTTASVISSGTERALTSLAQSSLLAKARARPDLVRQVVRKAKAEGVVQASRAVRSRLESDLPLGYSAAGVVVEVGRHVPGLVPGQLVATAGAGKANHAEYQAVPGLLCAAVPAGVEAEEAAFATVASIALHGLRLAELGPGAKIVVVGLGLVGQLAVRLAQASGLDVAGIDVADHPLELARGAGALALAEQGEETTAAVLEWSRGRGADAVLVCAASASSDLVARTPALARDRAPVVMVGDVGLHLARTPFHEKELSLRFARSYGPGRYERAYEEWGVDYPPGQVRWTEGRNLEAVLDLLAGGRLRVADLVTHRFPVEKAPEAYELIEQRAEPCLGVVLTYPGGGDRPAGQAVRLRAPVAGTGDGVGLIGAGAFASTVLVPGLKAAGFGRFVSVASASGLSARRLAERGGFEQAVSGAEAVISDADVAVVVIATPHDTHARLVTAALAAGKHVFCEKPLALSFDEADEVEAAWREAGTTLFVGFNRRWSPVVRRARELVGGAGGPLVVTYRVSAGRLPERHWYHDRRQGGRMLGEACHFVDTCAAVVGEAAAGVVSAGGPGPELDLVEDFAVALRYPSGSVASVTYASGGHSSTSKERIEVLGRGHSVVVDDFSSLVVDGRAERLAGQDKGHRALLSAFRAAVGRGGDKTVTLDALATTRTTLEALGGLGRS